MENTLIGYVLHLKRLFFTLGINLGALYFYYSLFSGTDWYISKGWAAAITICVTAIVVAFWLLSYQTFKSKKNENNSLGR